MSDFIMKSRCSEGRETTGEMLNEYMKKYGVEEHDWGKGYWDTEWERRCIRQ